MEIKRWIWGFVLINYGSCVFVVHCFFIDRYIFCWVELRAVLQVFKTSLVVVSCAKGVLILWEMLWDMWVIIIMAKYLQNPLKLVKEIFPFCRTHCRLIKRAMYNFVRLNNCVIILCISRHVYILQFCWSSFVKVLFVRMLWDSFFYRNEFLCRISSNVDISIYFFFLLNGPRFILFKKYLIVKCYVLVKGMKFQVWLCFDW